MLTAHYNRVRFLRLQQLTVIAQWLVLCIVAAATSVQIRVMALWNKESSSLWSCFLSLQCRHHKTLSESPCGDGAQGTGTNANTLTTTFAVSDKLSFVSDPRFQCLLPAPMKLWPAYILACKQGQTLRAVTVLNNAHLQR